MNISGIINDDLLIGTASSDIIDGLAGGDRRES
ncbi:hypothetical protein NIES2100_10240 [Calothrix sp. NIES-2100]|nr:hypothetical protein NIES2100_10240 [Calothrix sp. NIES-2100]